MSRRMSTRKRSRQWRLRRTRTKSLLLRLLMRKKKYPNLNRPKLSLHKKSKMSRRLKKRHHRKRN